MLCGVFKPLSCGRAADLLSWDAAQHRRGDCSIDASRTAHAIPVWIRSVHVISFQHVLSRHDMLRDERPHAPYEVRCYWRRVEP